MAARTNHDNAEDTSGLFDKAAIPEEPSAPKIETLMNILDSLLMHGNLRRIELHRRSSIKYVKLIEYLDWLKSKNFVIEGNSHITISERGRTLYSILA